MKNSLVFLVILFLSVITELGSFFVWKRFPVFYNSKIEQDEINSPLYSGLDPLLGYTHNSNIQISKKQFRAYYPESKNFKHIEGDYLVFSHEESKNPIRIATYGSCSTDSFVYSGNWPLALHNILIKAEIPHIIYNGAVSGYTSYQELNKIIRDIPELDHNLNIVISYNGVTDGPLTGDTIDEGYYHIHPYQRAIYDAISGKVNFDRDPIIMPNAHHLLRKLKQLFFSNSSSTVSYGVAKNNRIKPYLRNIAYMNNILSANGVEFLHLQTDVATPNDQVAISKKEWEDNVDETTKKEVWKFINEAKDGLSTFSFSKSLLGELPRGEPIFISHANLNARGSELLAKRILEELKRSKSWKTHFQKLK